MKDSKTLDGKTIVVKYGNRKLYNRDTAQYINLTELLDLGPGNFIVQDNVTKQDITDEVVLSALVKQYEGSEAELLEIIQTGIDQLEEEESKQTADFGLTQGV